MMESTSGLHTGDTSAQSAAPDAAAKLRRRNRNTAFALVLAALSLVFAFDFEGNVRILWRDAPLVALMFALAAAFFAVRLWRTSRS